ncbi:MAG: DoxX family protein [Acidobacteriota bacterium]
MLGRLDSLRWLAPVILRLVVGVIFVVHGYGKIFGGMERLTSHVQAMGFPGFMAWAAAGAEFFGGVALLLGLFTRWAALGIACVMAVAVFKVHWAGGLTGEHGFEYPLTLLCVAVSLMLTGGGTLSLDRYAIEKRR